MQAKNQKIVLCGGARTPIGHIAQSFAGQKPEDLMKLAVEACLARTKTPKEAVDGVIVGWVGQSFSAPNIARVTVLKTGLPEKTPAVTVQNNCVSSIEAISAAARFILAGEGSLYIAGGTEVMSRMPYTIEGSRAHKSLRSIGIVKEKWGEMLQQADVAVVDSIEEGLTDPVAKVNMAGAAEISAQMYDITREQQDEYARESFRKAIEGWNKGFYDSHVVSAGSNGSTILAKDEYPFLRESLVTKPQLFGKAPVAYDNSQYSIKRFYEEFGQFIEGKTYHEGAKGTVTLYNACGRSDGAAALIVATEARAKELGLEILAELKGWGFYGNHPAHMGVSPALAAPVALKQAGISFDQLDSIELHEPFAATVLGIFKLGKQKFGHDWEAKNKEGKLNPHGGSIALGHPLGATGARLMLNLLYAMKQNPKSKHGMIAACAGGGMGGAMVVEKVN